MDLGTSALAASVGLIASLTGDREVRVAGQDVHLADVARLQGDQANRMGRLVIARLPAGSKRLLPLAELAELVRRAVPAMHIGGEESGSITLVSTAKTEPTRPAGPCFETTRAIARGQAITVEDVRAVECSGARPVAAAVRGRNSDRVAPVFPIQAGQYLGRLLLSVPPLIGRGDKLTLVSRAGPVTIRREVTAVQDTSMGQRRLFVRTGDGAIFAAPMPTDGGQ